MCIIKKGKLCQKHQNKVDLLKFVSEVVIFLMKNFETGKVTTVPMHSKELAKGTEEAILKQAGLK